MIDQRAPSALLRMRELYGRRASPAQLAMLLALGSRRNIIDRVEVCRRMERLLQREVSVSSLGPTLRRLRRQVDGVEIVTHYGLGLQLLEAPHLWREGRQ